MRIFVSWLLLVAVAVGTGAQEQELSVMHRRLQGEIALPMSQRFLGRISDIDRALLFRLEGERIRFAADGAPLLNDIRTPLMDEWHRQVQAVRAETLTEWEMETQSRLERELALVVDRELRSQLERLLADDIADLRDHAERELERLYLQAAQAVVAASEGGQQQPDWHPESQLGRVEADITQRLAGAREAGRQALPEISTLLAAIGLPEDQDMRLRDDLERGLLRWQDSEHDLVRQRFLWEQAAQGQLSEGEHLWNEVAARVAAGREEWQGAFAEQMQAAEIEWEARRERLERDSAARSQELEQHAYSVAEQLALSIDHLRGTNERAHHIELVADQALGILATRVDSLNADIELVADQALGIFAIFFGSPKANVVQANAIRSEIALLEEEIRFWRSRQSAAADLRSMVEDSIGQMAARARLDLPHEQREGQHSAHIHELDRLGAQLAHIDGQIAIVAPLADYARRRAVGDEQLPTADELHLRYQSVEEQYANSVAHYEQQRIQAAAARSRLDIAAANWHTARQALAAARIRRDELYLRYSAGELPQRELAAADQQLARLNNQAEQLAAAVARYTSDYDEGRTRSEDAYQAAVGQGQELYRAEALYRYAEIDVSDPQPTLDALQSRRAQLEQVIAIVSAAGATQGTWYTRLDDGYLLQKRQELELLSARQYLSYMRQTLEARRGEQQQQLAGLESDLTTSAKALFYFGAREQYHHTRRQHSLDELSTIHSSAAYFRRADSDERYSRDTAIWLTYLRPNDLEDFVQVYYRRQIDFDSTAQRIPTTIFDDRYYKLLKNSERIKSDVGNGLIRRTRRELEDVEERVRSDPRSDRLYNFFEAMYSSGRLPAIDTYASEAIHAVMRSIFRDRVRRKTREMKSWCPLHSFLCPYWDEAERMNNRVDNIADRNGGGRAG